MDIFPTDDDKTVFLNIIRMVQREFNFQIFAYSIMDNHYHLLIKDVGKNLSLIIGTIQEKYAIYFNAKYDREGAVFMKPFKSKEVMTKGYFFKLVCYILNNPVSACIVRDYRKYKWNSPLCGYERYNLTDYLYIHFYYKPIMGLALHDYILKRGKSKQICELEKIHLSNDEATEKFYKILKDVTGRTRFDSTILSKNEKTRILGEAQYRGITTRQIAKITGMSKSAVAKYKIKRAYL